MEDQPRGAKTGEQAFRAGGRRTGAGAGRAARARRRAPPPRPPRRRAASPPLFPIRRRVSSLPPRGGGCAHASPRARGRDRAPPAGRAPPHPQAGAPSFARRNPERPLPRRGPGTRAGAGRPRSRPRLGRDPGRSGRPGMAPRAGEAWKTPAAAGTLEGPLRGHRHDGSDRAPEVRDQEGSVGPSPEARPSAPPARERAARPPQDGSAAAQRDRGHGPPDPDAVPAGQAPAELRGRHRLRDHRRRALPRQHLPPARHVDGRLPPHPVPDPAGLGR